MKKVNFKFEYADERLYNVCDVIDNFFLYFGVSIEQMKELFLNYNIISKDDLFQYLELYCKALNVDGHDVCCKGVGDYQYLTSVLNILSKKGLVYLSLLEYLKKLDDKLEKKDIRFEEQLEQLGIFHYHSVMIGEDIKRILNALKHTLKYFELDLNKLNYFHTFHQKAVSSFSVSGDAKIYGNRVYPESSIIISEGMLEDKTSILIKKKYFKKKKRSINY